MHRLRSKQRKKGRIPLNQEQLAQERLIQISVMPENQDQVNEVDMFVQKLSPVFADPSQMRPKRSKTFQRRAKTQQPLEVTESKTSVNSFCNSLMHANQLTSPKRPFNVSTIKMICLHQSFAPRRGTIRKYNSQSQLVSKEKKSEKMAVQRKKTTFSFFNKLHEEKCQSMRTRLKKNVNEEIISAFQVTNIKLEHRFEHYIKDFKKMMRSWV